MNNKKIKVLKYLTGIISLISIFMIFVLTCLDVKAMEKSDLITITAENFTIFSNDLKEDINGNLGGTIIFRSEYNYYLANDSNTIYVGGYGISNYNTNFGIYHQVAGDYDIFDKNKITHENINFTAIQFITDYEFPKSIINPPNGTYDIIIGDDSVNATLQEPGFPTDTHTIIIQLTYTLDPIKTYDYTGYNINDLKLIDDFKFYIYESDYMDGFYSGYDLGKDISAQQSYLEGYGVARSEYGYYDPNGWVWRNYQYGYNSGKIDGEIIGYDIGYDEAYDLAYTIGKTAGQGQTIEESLSFFTILSTAFSAVGSILGIELIPNITIGAIVLVPLVFGLMAFIIGISKGGKK